MKIHAKILILLTGLLSISLLASCFPANVVNGSGPVVTRDYAENGFTGVDIGHAFQIEIVPSTTYKVSITTNENLFNYLIVAKSGDTLKIQVKGAIIPFGTTTMKAYVEMPELRSLTLSGASRGTVKGFKSAQPFKLEVSGASGLDMDMETGDFNAEVSGASWTAGYIKAADFRADVSGASRIELTGSVRNAKLDVSGASQANIANLTVNDADINLSGASNAKVSPNGKMNVQLSGASTMEYGGNPTLGTVEVTGGSSLKRK